MYEPKREFITTSETILFVSSLFMWLYIVRFFGTIDSAWWIFPLLCFLLFLRSFIGRRVDLSFNWVEEEEARKSEQK
ncbi:hypothetical protein HNY42_08595 [Exiguobacterium sp. Helios]|uniref:hypothetical protein n=1 Tax=Exiguobacterium sp. Helios TaxID=2735868 RepID=UPI00165DB310|nr:hypothetical protein [Exiguobacterium sp. Helios]QNR20990.1 hypothetical protein HNY42_08595 [Exiguobacterium sp. Helios]